MPINDKIDQNKRKLMFEEWKGEADLVKADNMSQIGERSLDSIFRVLSSIRIQVHSWNLEKFPAKKERKNAGNVSVARMRKPWSTIVAKLVFSVSQTGIRQNCA